jgi:hypothetical protein
VSKRPIKGFEEQDALTGWRHVLSYVQKPGVRAAIKRRYRRKERRAGKQENRSVTLTLRNGEED